MKSDKWEKHEKKKREITEHFKKEKRKAFIVWAVFEIAAVGAGGALLAKQHLQWFLVALFFVVVFPTTLLSKKLKELSALQEKQIKLAESEGI